MRAFPLPRPLVIALSLFLASLGTPGGASEHGTTVSPGQVLQELVTGNERFVAGKSQHEKGDPSRRKELAGGQSPNAVILTCSDSRVPPELIFDKGLGELFVIRVAGNILGIATVASIEYAVEHLGSSLIVVMGHESCGAVKAAISMPRGQSAGSYDLDGLVLNIQEHLNGMEASSSDKVLHKPAVANVDGVVTELFARSKIVHHLVEQKKVGVVRAIYSLESGKVEFWGLQ